MKASRQALTPQTGPKSGRQVFFSTQSSLFQKSWKQNWELYLCLIPVIAFFIIFHYLPMYGVQIAFRDYNPVGGITGSPWVGLKHFSRFFNSYYFGRLLRNTIGLSLYQLLVAFPIPILLAVLISELSNKRFRKTVQMVTYAPHFLSIVVVVSMLSNFLSPVSGIVNHALGVFGIEPVYFMAETAWFKTLYVFSGVWQEAGWSSVIYIAAIAGIDPSLYEAAIVDGASKIKRIIHITVPCILPTIMILLIMQCGRVMSVGFEKVFLMQNNLNLDSSEVISTYVYKAGMLNAQYSFSTAVGLFNSVINCILLVSVNKLSKKLNQTGLF